MIRAMIGTVAVLAGFAVVECSTDAGTRLKSSVDVKRPGTTPTVTPTDTLVGAAEPRSSGR